MSPWARATVARSAAGSASAGGGASAGDIATRLIALALAAIVWCAVAGWPHPAQAQDAAAQDVALPAGDYAALRDYAQQIGGAEDQSGIAGPADRDAAFAALSDFAQTLKRDQGVAAKPAQIELADADNAFDALREFLQKHNGSAPAEPETPPSMAPARHEAVPSSPAIGATLVGSNVCLGCHGAQIEAYKYTMMGRLQLQGKLQCETCHGPGSVHIREVGCASCHGDGGITTRPGIPSLVGQEPQYLVAAMKDYIGGQRHNALMTVLLKGLSAIEFDEIADYYARQVPDRAHTQLIGDPAAGRAAIATCAACHGERGIGVSPAFPNLAGQDATYLADAIRAYRSGSRKKEVACSACHGDHGITRTPGIPSLVGRDAQYLVAAMKAYANGQRKSTVMRELVSGLSDAELNNMALYFAQQSPARAQTPSIGDAAAGKAAAASCAACHGAEGVSSNPAWPSLAGQDARYFIEAIDAYKNGSRTDPTMKALAASLDQQTIENLAAYYASQRPEQPASAKNTPAKPAPIVLANRLLAELDHSAIVNIASYYGSLRPVEPAITRQERASPVPRVVRVVAPVDGASVGGIISFRPNDPARTAEQNNHICLNCHERGERTMWEGSPHEERGLSCTNCHTIMQAVSAKNQLKTASQPDTCFQCHKEIRNKILMSAHMPVREGKVVCSDCHNPHGSFTEAMLRTDTINDTCYKCHAEKRGPFLFEHEPVRENCLNCHDPHGSMNEYMLKMSRPRLCYECHTIGHAPTGGLNLQFTMGRACQNCHTMIHGSNSPGGFLLFR